MKLEILIDGIESKIKQLEYEDNDISEVINKTQYYLTGWLINDDVKNKFNDYITEYSQSYFFSQRDPAFKNLLEQDYAKKSVYTERSGKLVWLATYAITYVAANYLIDIQNLSELFITMLGSWGVARIAENIETQKKFFAKKYLNMPGQEDVFGSTDYNKALRKNFIEELKQDISYKIEN
jgi:hypothetical protein